MSTGLGAFDAAIHDSLQWVKGVEAQLPGAERREAYAALRATLHGLRDRLDDEAMFELAAGLPMMLRGLFMEGWRPATRETHAPTEGFVQAVARRLPGDFAVDPERAVRAVFAVMTDQLPPLESRRLIDRLPARIRELWPAMLWAV